MLLVGAFWAIGIATWCFINYIITFRIPKQSNSVATEEEEYIIPNCASIAKSHSIDVTQGIYYDMGIFKFQQKLTVNYPILVEAVHAASYLTQNSDLSKLLCLFDTFFMHYEANSEWPPNTHEIWKLMSSLNADGAWYYSHKYNTTMRNILLNRSKNMKFGIVHDTFGACGDNHNTTLCCSDDKINSEIYLTNVFLDILNDESIPNTTKYITSIVIIVHEFIHIKYHALYVYKKPTHLENIQLDKHLSMRDWIHDGYFVNIWVFFGRRLEHHTSIKNVDTCLFIDIKNSFNGITRHFRVSSAQFATKKQFLFCQTLNHFFQKRDSQMIAAVYDNFDAQ